MTSQRTGALNRGSILLIASITSVALIIGFYAGQREMPIAPSIDKSHDAMAVGLTEKRPATTKSIKMRQPQIATSAFSAPLPPARTPLKQTFADLQARADAGDATAASRLYRDLQRCAQTQNINATVPHAAGFFLNEKTDAMSTTELQSRDSMLNSLQSQLNFARNNAELCAGLSSAQIDEVVPASMQAALTGDAVAANCYLGSSLIAAQGILDHPEWLSDYKDNALNIANTNIQNGDWTTVHILQRAYAHIFRGGLLGQVTGADVVQNYRYLKLLRLGAQPGKDAGFFDNQIGEIADQIGPDAQLAADAWAQDTYQRYFAANPQNRPPTNTINICQIDDL
jgi:hypothetical protein